MIRKAMLMSVLCVAAMSMAARAEKVDFAKQIVPILADRCYKCHGVEKDKGGLRLNTKEAILKGGDDAKTFVASKPAESEIFKRVSLPADDEDIMPPKGDPLTKDQQELIKQWIAEGADFGAWTEDKNAAAPKGEVLPQVPAADGKAIEKLASLGALAMPLAKDTNLINVDFRAEADKIGDSHLVHLKPVATQIAWLNLANTKITDDGLAQLEELKNLRRLHLEKTAIGDAGLAHLKGLSELRYLNLYGTKVTDAGLANLKGLANLEKLYLWQTAVTDAGAADLQKALPNLQIDRGWTAPKEEPKEAGKTADAGAAINGTCPVSGKPVDAAQFSEFQGQKIGFCCEKCKAKFDANPAEVVKKVKEFKPAA